LKESQSCIKEVKKLLEEGGDWEKKNKLKVKSKILIIYKGI
jgi:hypothetical protein